MTDSWTAFLRDSEPHDHAVQAYTDIAELANTVAAYLAAGFDRGDPALVVATPEHLASFAAALQARDWPAARVEQSGLLFVEDAEETMTALGEDGEPSWTAFETLVGGAIDRIAARFPNGRIRAFGEVVDLLCERGNARGAEVLEEHWNRLAETRSFSLLCSYRLDPFDPSAQVSLLPAVCHAHSHVLPAEDPTRFQQAVDTALDETLGRDAGKVYALVGAQARARNVPEAQLALMWGALPQQAVAGSPCGAIRAGPDAALRARGQSASEMTVDTTQIRDAHVALRQDLQMLAEAARSMPELSREERAAVRDSVVAWLRDTVDPHTRLDERVLYREVAARLDDPLATASMAYDHLAIRFWIDKIAATSPDAPERLQELLYGLDALIAVHVWKENELYLAMLESPSWPAATASSV